MEMVTLVTRKGNVIDSMSSRLLRFVPLNLYELYTTIVHLSNKHLCFCFLRVIVQHENVNCALLTAIEE